MSTVPAPGVRPRAFKAKYALFIVYIAMTVYVLATRDLTLLDPGSPLRQRYAPIPWLMIVHGGFGALALVLGIFQFSTRLRRRYFKVHRTWDTRMWWGSPSRPPSR